MNYRFYVDGFSGYATDLGGIKAKVNALRDSNNLEGCVLKIWKNQGPTDSVFEHVGPVDRSLIIGE